MSLSPPISRLVAATLLLLCIGCGWTVLWAPPIRAIAEDRSRIGLSQRLLFRYDQAIALGPSLHRQLETMNAADPTGTELLQPAARALMAANLQAAVQRMAAEAGVALQSSRTDPVRNVGSLDRLGLDLEFSASMPRLSRLLYRFETARPVIVVERLAVDVPENAATARSDDGQPSLTVGLTIAAFARPQSPVSGR